jgi:hypothetical protein
MPPVDPPRFRVQWLPLVQVAVFLPQFVGEKEGDNKQRNHQKNAQYQVLDHDGLRLQEHDLIVEHHTSPRGIPPLRRKLAIDAAFAWHRLSSARKPLFRIFW